MSSSSVVPPLPLPPDDWRHPGRITVGAFVHPAFAKNLKLHPRDPSPSTSSACSTVTDDESASKPSSPSHRRPLQADTSEIANTRPASSFVREPSPALSECSGVSVRASSLIQMWRELEAEAGPVPTQRDGDWDCDAVAREPARTSSLQESEAGRVGHIVRMLSLGSRTLSDEASSSEENDGRSRECREFGRKEGFWGLAHRRIRRRHDIDELMARIVQERRRELDSMAERQPVSRFSHRGRIQTLIRLMFMRREVSAQTQEERAPRLQEMKHSQNRSKITLLRQRFNNVNQQDGDQVQALECPGSTPVEPPVNSQYPWDAGLTVQLHNGDNQCEEVVFSRDSENTPAGLNTPPAEEEQEERETPDLSWEERNLPGSPIEWEGLLYSPQLHVWHVEPVTKEPELYAQENIGDTEYTWINTTDYNPSLENFSDNVEIQELLQRRPVSTSLASDFRDRMDRLMLSFLHKQEQQYFSENFKEEYDEHPVWRTNGEFHDADQTPSSSLAQLPFQTMHNKENWQHDSLPHQSSQHSLDSEAIHDLRNDMAQIHHEICELRKLVESCTQWQVSLQHSIKQEVSAAVRQSATTSHCSNCTPANKGKCCICHEMQVDTLLYRCGHMCTCFQCAHELHWSSGRCPICRATIVDIVQAYSQSQMLLQ